METKITNNQDETSITVTRSDGTSVDFCTFSREREFSIGVTKGEEHQQITLSAYEAGIMLTHLHNTCANLGIALSANLRVAVECLYQDYLGGDLFATEENGKKSLDGYILEECTEDWLADNFNMSLEEVQELIITPLRNERLILKACPINRNL